MNKIMNKKLIVLTVAWFLLVVCAMMMLIGCATSKPDFEPLPPLKLQDFLHQPNKHFACSGCSKCKQVLWAYKSPTIKEIIGEKDFN